MRAAIAIVGLLALGGCIGDDARIDQPSMYISMANGGARLDPEGAASMISLYPQNNGLGGGGGVSPRLRLAGTQGAGLGNPNKPAPHTKAPRAPQPSACR